MRPARRRRTESTDSFCGIRKIDSPGRQSAEQLSPNRRSKLRQPLGRLRALSQLSTLLRESNRARPGIGQGSNSLVCLSNPSCNRFEPVRKLLRFPSMNRGCRVQPRKLCPEPSRYESVVDGKSSPELNNRRRQRVNQKILPITDSADGEFVRRDGVVQVDYLPKP